MVALVDADNKKARDLRAFVAREPPPVDAWRT
jgi:hypothetical protein